MLMDCSTTLLWTSNLLNTQHQIFGVERSRSTSSLSPTLLSNWGSHCCRRWYLHFMWRLARILSPTLLSNRGSHCGRRWYLHFMWRLARIQKYVQPSFQGSWTEIQRWHAADETRYQTCCWVCPYVPKNMCPTSSSPRESHHDSFIQQNGRFGRVVKACAC